MSSNMFYAIVPPALVVLSLAGIVWFLVKKSSKINAVNIAPQELAAKNPIGRPNWKDGKAEAQAASSGIGRAFRNIFAKIKDAFRKIKPRFKIGSRNERPRIENILDADVFPEEEVIRRVHGFNIKKIREEKSAANFARQKKDDQPKSEKKSVKTVVSRQEVAPRIKTEIKDRLEELLIERIAVNPKDIEAYERLGEYYMEIESYEFAKECFKQVIKLDPTNKNVKYKMKRLEYLLGR